MYKTGRRTFPITMHSTTLGLSCLVAFFGASAAVAHDIWLTADKAGDQVVAQVNFGDLVDRKMADLEKIVSLDLVTEGKSSDLRRPLTIGQRLGKPVWITKQFVAGGSSVVSVSYDNGFWLTGAGDSFDTNASKAMVPNGSKPHLTLKYGKLLLGRDGYKQILHSRLELIPLKDPYTLPAGVSLPVRLQLDGKPFAGADIAYTDGVAPIPDPQQPTVKTDAQGVAELPASKKGPHLLTVEIEAPAVHADLADFDHLYASLSFDTSR